MKQKLMSLFIGSILLLYITGCCKPEISGNVPSVLRPQETNNWCWAAVTQMLAQHVGISVTQCSLANHRLGFSNCCTVQNAGSSCPKTNVCDSAGWVSEPLSFAGVKYSESGTALSWDAVQKQIYCSKKPMGYAYGNSPYVGHVVLIKGYITVGSTNYIILNDPWAPCGGQERLITYQEYKDPAGPSTHWNTWYDIAKK